jgi:hypothetical protein
LFLEPNWAHTTVYWWIGAWRRGLDFGTCFIFL